MRHDSGPLSVQSRVNASRDAIRDLIEALHVVAAGPNEALESMARVLHEQTHHIDYYGVVTKRRTPTLALWKARFAFADDWCMSPIEEAIAFEDEHQCVMLLSSSVNGTLAIRSGAKMPEEWSVRSAWRIEAKFGLITEFAEFGDARDMLERFEAWQSSSR